MAQESAELPGLEHDRQGIHARVATVRRVAWAVLALLVIAALLGLFGGQGLYSATTTRTADAALELHYERLTRLSAPAVLDIRVAPEHVRAGRIRLQLDREYTRAARIERITPAPLRVESGGPGLRYEFAGDAGSPARIVFHMQMEDIGALRGKLTLLPDHSLAFTQIVYP